MPDKQIFLAQIGAPHGIKGEVRVKPFGEPDMLNQYGKLQSKDGAKFKITRMRPQKTVMVVKFEGINSREEAEVLNGIELFVDRAKLPAPDAEEFYVSDLIGLEVFDEKNMPLGKVIDVPNFGADDMLEIGNSTSDAFYLPFTLEIVPHIDFEKNSLQVIRPTEVSERDK